MDQSGLSLKIDTRAKNDLPVKSQSTPSNSEPVVLFNSLGSFPQPGTVFLTRESRAATIHFRLNSIPAILTKLG